ncbi:MAG: hypothetical protein ACOYU7_10985 [Bacillota bacterium]
MLNECVARVDGKQFQLHVEAVVAETLGVDVRAELKKACGIPGVYLQQTMQKGKC